MNLLINFVFLLSCQLLLIPVLQYCINLQILDILLAEIFIFSLDSKRILYRIFLNQRRYLSKRPITVFFNKQLDFGPALKSCLTYLVFQPSQSDW